MPENMPEQDELVLVDSQEDNALRGVLHAGRVFGNREAFVHISEVAPRWIKNIHEFLREGQQLVAKVYHIEVEKEQIDLSLKRVTESERKAKMEGSRRERRADKLFEVALKIAKSTKNEEIAARQALSAEIRQRGGRAGVDRRAGRGRACRHESGEGAAQGPA